MMQVETKQQMLRKQTQVIKTKSYQISIVNLRTCFQYEAIHKDFLTTSRQGLLG
jgi:hypothetical protein